MTTSPPPLDNLIGYVKSLKPDGVSLDHLSDAVLVAQELNDQADSLIGHFVDQARVSGASWSQIGNAMGVTKQAAQKRFAIRDEPLLPKSRAFSRFTPRARISVAAAGKLAEAGGHYAIDAHHLVAGTIVDPEGLAARALTRLGVSDSQIYQALGVGPATTLDDPDIETLWGLHYTQACREAFKQALRAALHLGHNYIGTEHLLLGAASTDGIAQEGLAKIGLQADVIEKAIEVEVADSQLQAKRQQGAPPTT